jgi:ATP-dependent helicase HrpB
VRREAERLRRRLGVSDAGAYDVEHLGLVLALAFPDRVARKRVLGGRYLLANGIGATVHSSDVLGTSDWLAVAELELYGREDDARILLAAPITRAEIDRVVEQRTEPDVGWDHRAKEVHMQLATRIGAIVLHSSPLDDPQLAVFGLLAGVKAEGLRLLPRLGSADALRARVAFCRTYLGHDWPDLADGTLLECLEDWLLPVLWSTGARRRADLKRVDVAAAVRTLVPAALLAQLDTLAPTHVVTAKGARKPVDYSSGDPTVSLRVQDAFGWHDTPAVAGGRVPLVVTLLSPADRPVQVTRDLEGFWRGSYRAVRAELRGRYPKHAWPEDPTRPQPGKGPPR